MKKPLMLPEEQHARRVRRADRAPVDGFSLVVDGHYKNEYPDEAAAKVAAAELLGRYPMLLIEIYDGEKQVRSKFS
ncbi:hypothetical protein [Afipia carboxidovorans]|uniref:hypothetical protein n=1 Tax=Afipia carboxidovorans TaxID=40137 RepID=UPI00308B72E0|nr:hypothetical protein CRBSH125_22000 [Afipia carboxidovorans]